MKHFLQIVGLALFSLSALAQSSPPPADSQPGKTFDQLADTALLAMSQRAEALKIQGVAVVAYVAGESTTAWSSKMVVVGSMKNAPTEKSKGANLLAIAYSKAAEMAETLKDSGSAGRPPMTGETGWQGGLIRKGRTGYLIAAFSGGPSESDVKVSQAGLEVLAGKFVEVAKPTFMHLIVLVWISPSTTRVLTPVGPCGSQTSSSCSLICLWM